jgi:hypothetical protein
MVAMCVQGVDGKIFSTSNPSKEECDRVMKAAFESSEKKN